MNVSCQSLNISRHCATQTSSALQAASPQCGQQVAATGLCGMFKDKFCSTQQANCLPQGGIPGELGQQGMQKILGLLKRLISVIEQLFAQMKNGQQPSQGGQAPAAGGGAAPAQGASAAGHQTPSSTNDSVPRGFLWKPVSESNGKCVVLLPSNMTGKVAGVTVKGPDGQTLESGRFSSVANGGREHYRLGKPGSAYPPGSTVEIQMRDGTTQSVRIPDTGRRVE